MRMQLCIEPKCQTLSLCPAIPWEQFHTLAHRSGFTHRHMHDDRYGRATSLAVRQGVARPRRRRASMPEILYSAMRPTVEPVAAPPPPPPPLSARPVLGPPSPPKQPTTSPQRPTTSPPSRRPRRLSKEFFPTPDSFVTATSAGESERSDADTELKPPRPPPGRQRRASRDSISVEGPIVANDSGEEAIGKGALWARVRGLLWRILDPAAAFPHLVRRTLSVHRACMLLRRTAPALAALGHTEIVAMVCAASEP